MHKRFTIYTQGSETMTQAAITLAAMRLAGFTHWNAKGYYNDRDGEHWEETTIITAILPEEAEPVVRLLIKEIGYKNSQNTILLEITPCYAESITIER